MTEIPNTSASGPKQAAREGRGREAAATPRPRPRRRAADAGRRARRRPSPRDPRPPARAQPRPPRPAGRRRGAGGGAGRRRRRRRAERSRAVAAAAAAAACRSAPVPAGTPSACSPSSSRGSIQDVKATPVDKVHIWPHLLAVEFVAALAVHRVHALLLDLRQRPAAPAGQRQPDAEPVEGAVVLPRPAGAAHDVPPDGRRRDHPGHGLCRADPRPVHRQEPVATSPRTASSPSRS